VVGEADAVQPGGLGAFDKLIGAQKAVVGHWVAVGVEVDEQNSKQQSRGEAGCPMIARAPGLRNAKLDKSQGDGKVSENPLVVSLWDLQRILAIRPLTGSGLTVRALA
jgi:hypothetical protein